MKGVNRAVEYKQGFPLTQEFGRISLQLRTVSKDSRAKSKKLSPVLLEPLATVVAEGGFMFKNRLSRFSATSDSDSGSVSPSISKNDGFRMMERRWMAFSRTPEVRTFPLEVAMDRGAGGVEVGRLLVPKELGCKGVVVVITVLGRSTSLTFV